MTSAEQAKQRLQWCVAQRRNGGAWIEAGCNIITITAYYSPGDVAERRFFHGLPNRYRWSYA